MKYCRPVFRLLYKQTPELAKKTFLAHQAFYVSHGGHTERDLMVAPYREEDDPTRLGTGQGLMRVFLASQVRAVCMQYRPECEWELAG